VKCPEDEDAQRERAHVDTRKGDMTNFVMQWGVPETNCTRCSKACSAQFKKNSEMISHNMP